MTDAISRSALMAQLSRKKSEVARVRYTEGFNDAILRVRSMVHSATSLDVAPVVHARWMLDSSFYSARIYHCTACYTKQMQTSKFCPECGARMDGEAE